MVLHRQGSRNQPFALRLQPPLALRVGEGWVQGARHSPLQRAGRHGGQAAAHHADPPLPVQR